MTSSTPPTPSGNELTAPSLAVNVVGGDAILTITNNEDMANHESQCVGDYLVVITKNGETAPVFSGEVARDAAPDKDTDFDISEYVKDAGEYTISVVLQAYKNQPTGHNHADSPQATVTGHPYGRPGQAVPSTR